MKKIGMVLAVVVAALFLFTSPGFSKSIGKYGERIAADFGSSGIYEWYNDEWTQIDNTDPDDDGGMVGIGDLLYVDYGSVACCVYNGIWVYDPNGGEELVDRWTRINTGNPESMGVYNGDLLADFGSNGLWVYVDATTWTRINTANPEQIFSVSATVLYVDFGSDGLWEYDGTDWTEISSANVEGMADFFKK